MNRYVFGALAFATASSLASGGTEVSSERGDWLSLDREISSLSTSLSNQGPSGFALSGFMRGRFQWSSDIDDVNGTGDDLTGFGMDNIRLNFDGSIGDYGVHVSADGVQYSAKSSTPNNSSILSSINGGGVQYSGPNSGGQAYVGDIGTPGSLEIVDAWITSPLGNNVNVTVGQFRAPFSNNALIDADRLLGPDRTFLGAAWDGRDLGVMFNGMSGRFGWWVAVQNGVDGVAEDFHYTLRASYTLLGAGGPPTVLGAHGMGQDEHAWVSAAYTSDDEDAVTGDDRTAYIIEGGYRTGPWFVSGEYGMMDEGFFPNTVGGPDDISPIAVLASYNFNNDWEAWVQLEDLGDDDDTTVYQIGVNYYQAAQDAKWYAAYVMTDSDNSAIEYDKIVLGYSVSVGRP